MEHYKELWRQLCLSKRHFCSRCPLNKICDHGEVFEYNVKKLKAIVEEWYNGERTCASDFLDKA